MRDRFEEWVQELPFNPNRLKNHIDQGDVKIGDFLHTYDTLVQSNLTARPYGRANLNRGDGDTFVTADGTPCVWTVSAVMPEITFITVIAASNAYHIAMSPSGPALHDNSAHIQELMAPCSTKSVWTEHRHRLDLWDWTPGREFGNGTTVLPDDGGWLVETSTGVFTWFFDGGRNIISPSMAMMPSKNIIRSLFLREPEFM